MGARQTWQRVASSAWLRVNPGGYARAVLVWGGVSRGYTYHHYHYYYHHHYYYY